MNRIQQVEKKFPEQAKAALAIDDPSKTNKYLLWIAKQLKSGHNSADIAASVNFFHENPTRFKVKDIFKYKDLKDLEDLIKEMGLSKRQEKEKDKEGAQKIFEDDNFLVIRVDDKPAMITYGSNTRWCTTMKDHHYYEDYVSQGNDFYIIITKNPEAVKSSKYAVVRKGLLEFQVYDAKDSYARSFDDKEVDLLREAVQAIVADKPPKNYLRLVCKGEIPAVQAAEWLKTQSEVTQKYVESKRPDIQFMQKSLAELAAIFANHYNRQHMRNMDYAKLVEFAKYLVTEKDTKHYPTKTDLITILNGDDKMILAADHDARIRAKVVVEVSPEKAKDFFGDRSLVVVKSAAHRVQVDDLFALVDNTESVRKKKAVNEVIIERISQEKVKKFVLSQPRDVIKELME